MQHRFIRSIEQINSAASGGYKEREDRQLLVCFTGGDGAVKFSFPRGF